MRLNILIGGKAGQGINQISQILAAVLVKKGFFVFHYRDYQSLIRGGHNFEVICFSDQEIASYDEEIDFLIALDETTYQQHKSQLKKKGLIITATDKLKGLKKSVFLDTTKFKRVENIAFVGFLSKVLGLDKKEIQLELKERFGQKSLYALDQEAFDYFYSLDYNLQVKLPQISGKKMLLSGSEAIMRGAIDAGLEMYFGYPMTPSTTVLTLLAQEQKMKNNKLIVISLENEIAVINAALGASFSGRRVMTGTSSGGFDLMSEGISLQGITELPLVIHLAQRTGPGTGVPTYTAQSDLNIALYAGHGDFSRVVFSPGDSAEVYQQTREAFYLAEKFGIVVIILTDKHLAESAYTTQLDKVNLKIPLRKEFAGRGIFKRSGYEHDQFWNTTEDAVQIKQNVDKRNKKRDELVREVKKLTTYQVYGKGKKLIVSFGSTKGAILDALKDLKGFSHLHLKCLEPFPIEVSNYFKKADTVYCLENNSSGQLARLITTNLVYQIKNKNLILKYDGRPFTPAEIVKRLKNV
ncbi:MAG: 2-oxoacid:acceptor oxidoreductase family protein [Nanoarchaeota archaeon]|nr:2-oxoacid:acceptor oxidoreductase family protein [Nanoarchaeota archaeon]